MKDEAQAATFTTLQTLMWPEFGICTERELYVCTEPVSYTHLTLPTILRV